MFAKNFIAWGLITVFSITILAGCGATVMGTKNQTSYELQRSLTAPVYWEVTVKGTPREVFDAAITATRDLSLSVTQQKSDQLTGIIDGYFADNTKFAIKIDYDSPGKTRLLITAGKTGDKTLVLQVFKAIEKHLPA